MVTVEGRISHADGTPATSATVQLLSLLIGKDGINELVPVATATTNFSGHYIIEGPDAPRWLFIKISGDLPTYQEMLPPVNYANPKPGVVRRLKKDVRLAKSFTLTGTIIAPDGAPLSHLPVHLESTPGADAVQHHYMEPSRTSTTTSGTFTMDHIPAGKWVIGALSPEYPLTKATVTVPATGPLMLQFREGGGRVRGAAKHLQGGASVEGLKVALAPFNLDGTESLKMETQTTVTAADGTFSFAPVSPGRIIVRVEPNTTHPLAAVPPAPGSFELADGETTDVQLLVYSGHTIFGRVYDATTSRPIPGAVISTHALNRDITATADNQGNYSLTGVVADSVIHLKPLAEGYTLTPPTAAADPFTMPSPNEVRIELTSEPLVIHQDIAMIPMVRLTGKVVTKDGVPVAHAQVYTRPATDFVSEEKPVPVTRDGTFAAFAVPNTYVSVAAMASGFGTSFTEEMQIASADLAGINIVLHVASAVRGKVLLPGGQPALGATVACRNNLPQQAASINQIGITDGTGSFNLDNLPSDLILNAALDGYTDSAPTILSLAPGEVHASLVLQLLPAFKITGRVLGADLAPLPQVTVTAQGAKGSVSSKTEDDGTFELADLEDGHYSVTATDSGNQAVASVKAGTANVEIIMPRRNTFKLIGLVIDDATQEPLQDFTIAMRPSKKLPKPGQFEISDLEPGGHYTIRISSPGYQEQNFPLVANTNSNEVKQIFRLGLGGAITGKVVDAQTAAPISGVTVTNWGGRLVNQNAYLQPDVKTTTDEDGRFTLGPAASGPNHLVLKPPPPYSTTVHTVDVKTEDVADVGSIRLQKGGTIYGAVLQNGKPRPDVQVYAQAMDSEQSIQEFTKTGPDGNYQITALPAGTYRVMANALSKIAELQWDSRTEVNFHMGTVTVTGMVTRAGYPVNAHIIATGDDGQTIPAVVQDGTYLMQDVASGTYDFAVGDQMFIHETVQVPDQEKFEKNFALPDCRVTVTVTDKTGKPMPGAEVRLQQTDPSAGPPIMAQLTNTTGVAEFPGLVPGSYSISAAKTQAGEANSGVHIEDGQNLSVKLQLQPTTENASTSPAP